MFSDLRPKFVKVFANTGDFMKKAFADYIKEVKEGSFPGPEHTYPINEEIVEILSNEYDVSMVVDAANYVEK